MENTKQRLETLEKWFTIATTKEAREEIMEEYRELKGLEENCPACEGRGRMNDFSKCKLCFGEE